MAFTDAQVTARADKVLNRITKWRAHFAGWQLGTRPSTDPECRAVRDHREATIVLRAEVNALTGLMIEKGAFTSREFTERLIDEAEHLDRSYTSRWPGCEAHDDGMHYLIPECAKSMEGWLP